MALQTLVRRLDCEHLHALDSNDFWFCTVLNGVLRLYDAVELDYNDVDMKLSAVLLM